jgi:nuclear transport factor 2 (NTF2) superfamily protein
VPYHYVDDDGELVSKLKEAYAKPLREVVARVELLGFTLDTARHHFMEHMALVDVPKEDTENRIAVRFAYEWYDDSGQWFRSYGNENWEFDENGLMCRRLACINDLPIKESERKYRWPLGRRPDDHPGLSDLGF